MKLIECYIEGFGKISRQKYSFTDGFNCIKGDNGSGKSTLAAFIKVMLYGMSDTKKMSLEENERKHYLPWGGGNAGGTLTFSVGSKTYRIERSFATKAADDSCCLYDTATGKICSDFGEVIGEGLFGIDADGFERTVFLSERSLTPKSENKSISAKLSDLVGCDGDIGGMDDAMKTLEEKRKFYHKKGGSGELAQIKSRIIDISRKLDSLEETEKALDEAHKKLIDLTNKSEAARSVAREINASREALTVKAAEVSFEKRRIQIQESLDDCLKRRTEVAELFGSDIPSYSKIDEISYKSTEAKSLLAAREESFDSKEFKMLSARFDGRISSQQIDGVRDAAKKLKEDASKENDPTVRRAKKIFKNRLPSKEELGRIDGLLTGSKAKLPIAYILLYLAFIIIGVLGIIFLPILLPASAVAIFITSLAQVITGVRARKKKWRIISDFFLSVSGVSVTDKAEAEARLKDMMEAYPFLSSTIDDEEKQRLISIIDEVTSLLPEYHNENEAECIGRIIEDYDRYASLALKERYVMGEREERRKRGESLYKEVQEFLGKYDTRTADPIGELRQGLTEYDRLTSEITARRSEIARLENRSKLGEDDHKRAIDELDALERRRVENDRLLADLAREYTLTERAYKGYIEELESRDELYMRRSELEEKLNRYQDNYDTVLLTKKYITLAKDNMTARYLGKTKAGFLKYAEAIGGISDESFEMDTDFGVTKQEGASTRSVEAYSRGTRDLFNLAARLALIDSLYESEDPFIILDDPFTALDDGKTEAALRLLKEHSKERQIIYFTCSKARSL